LNNAQLYVSTVLASLFLPLVASAAPRQEKVLTIEEAVDSKSVSSPAIDPRGERAAWVLRVPRTADEDPGGAHSEVWVGNLEGPTEARRFTPRGVDSHSPAWAPDGSGLAFLSRREEVHEETQIYLAPIDGGEASAVTEHEPGIRSFAFSPDGSRIAFRARDAKTKAQEEEEQQGRDWQVVDVVRRFDRLWTVELESGEITKVYEGDLNAVSFVWTPDGASLVFQGR
jgi:dipeptidyl aminopeptidase/acylaminoacyl peptidase